MEWSVTTEQTCQLARSLFPARHVHVILKRDEPLGVTSIVVPGREETSRVSAAGGRTVSPARYARLALAGSTRHDTPKLETTRNEGLQGVPLAGSRRSNPTIRIPACLSQSLLNLQMASIYSDVCLLLFRIFSLRVTTSIEPLALYIHSFISQTKSKHHSAYLYQQHPSGSNLHDHDPPPLSPDVTAFPPSHLQPP